ncbi:MAG: hypothetical protein SF028_09475 [Candidatus Sumerlaeia bacterium]|nr:hypothetical protein [Candidatus Sumerlaeia bacterium]
MVRRIDFHSGAPPMFESFFPPDPAELDDSHLELRDRLARRAWRVESLILHSDLPWIDIELEIAAMRRLVEEEWPERLPLFEALYAERFDRLESQWGHARSAF